MYTNWTVTTEEKAEKHLVIYTKGSFGNDGFSGTIEVEDPNTMRRYFVTGEISYDEYNWGAYSKHLPEEL